MKLLHLSDLHLRSAPDALQNVRFRACIDRLMAEHADADLCLITGDLAEDPSEATYQFLRDEVSRLPFQTHLLLGNHDRRDAAFAALPRLARNTHGFAQSVVATPAGPLIILDTLDEGRHGGMLCARRLDWLAATLASMRGTGVMIALHHAPFATGLAGMDAYGLDPEAAATLSRLLADHGAVRHLFFGHYHRLIHGQWQGIPFSCLPSFGEQVALRQPDPVDVAMTPGPAHFAVVTISEGLTLIHSEALADPGAPTSP